MLFARVEKHGKPLYNNIRQSTDKEVYFVAGEVETDRREEIRKLVNNSSGCIIVASMGTFSEGVNIPNLNNLIIAMPTKSHIKVVQMIGRVLRKSKLATRVFDITDVLTHNGKKNYALEHAFERIKIYAEKNFKYVFKNVTVQENNPDGSINQHLTKEVKANSG